jgi:signal transduction histidine kinase
MRQTWQGLRWWWLAGAAIALAGAAWLALRALNEQHAQFETQARIVHRLLSQQVVQHDAILATLSLLQPANDGPVGTGAEKRLPALYPQILTVQRRDPDTSWPDDQLARAEAVSRQTGRAAPASPDLHSGRYRLVLAATPTSYALTIDLNAMVPWAEWPLPREGSPVRVVLSHAGTEHVIQPGQGEPMSASSVRRLAFQKVLAADSQPFDVLATQAIGWQHLPWGRMGLWALMVALSLTVLHHLQTQRNARRRAEELLRLGQVGRLNTLGELAAGMAHELNQPLTAVLANTQAAQRLLNDDPPEIATARSAMLQATAQAKRAAEVVGRLRHALERPDRTGAHASVDAVDAVRRALYLLEPECQRLGVTPVLEAPQPVTVRADPVALDQIVHNLIQNALQALAHTPTAQRRLTLTVSAHAEMADISVIDSGPGIPPEVLPRLFEPFFTTRPGGLGLGLSLCQTLAQGMDGRLDAAQGPDGGAVFHLQLPLATRAP